MTTKEKFKFIWRFAWHLMDVKSVFYSLFVFCLVVTPLCADRWLSGSYPHPMNLAWHWLFGLLSLLIIALVGALIALAILLLEQLVKGIKIFSKSLANGISLSWKQAHEDVLNPEQ